MLDSIDNEHIPSARWKIKKYGVDKTTGVLIRSDLRNEYFEYLERGDPYVQLQLGGELPDESFSYTEEELLILSKLSDRIEVSFVKYSDLDTLREVLNLLSDSVDFYIDNDYCTLLRNNEFIQLWNDNPTWNWMQDSLEED
jgi:hypothetical protein